MRLSPQRDRIWPFVAILAVSLALLSGALAGLAYGKSQSALRHVAEVAKAQADSAHRQADIAKREAALATTQAEQAKADQTFLQDVFCGLVAPIGDTEVTVKVGPLGQKLIVAGRHAAKALECPPSKPLGH